MEADSGLRTLFAPPERASGDEIKRSAASLVALPTLDDVFAVVSNALAILNGQRQIVYANREYLAFVGTETLDSILGLRSGEAAGCIHSGEMAAGCGTAEQCRYCGALQAVLECVRTGRRVERETRLTIETATGKVGLDLIVTAIPFEQGLDRYTVIALRDNRDAKRREVMERLFFHDIVNYAGGIHGALALINDLNDKNDGKELFGLSFMTSENLLEELQNYSVLTSAERGDLRIASERIEALDALKQTALLVRYYELAWKKRVSIDQNSETAYVDADPRILRRVLVNMLKNALEATSDKGFVKAGVHRDSDGKIVFKVWNDTVMSDEVRGQIFQKSFSTKGMGRGLGTWSILLLGERYLSGRVAFTSREGQGTEFTLALDAADGMSE